MILINYTASIQLLSALIDYRGSEPYFAPMTPFERRANIILRNEELENSGMGCKGCSGACCTFEANSMMVTPVEAVELVDYLKEKNLFTDELKSRLTETVSKFRLDQGLGNGKRSFIRRTYTCPFFNHTELGCPIPREVKPYGCIAFNSHDVEKKAGEHCYSEKEILEKREMNDPNEAKLNEELKKKYSLWWDKVPMPVALLDFFRNE